MRCVVAAYLAIVCPSAAADCLKVDLNDASFTTARENTINPLEAVEFAFDGDIHTKWLDYSGGLVSWVEVDMGSAFAVSTYGIVSGNDAAERDPVDWVLSGSNDGGDTWDALDVQTGVVFEEREQRRAFQINDQYAEYQLVRLNVTKVVGGEDPELMQISELELWYGYGCHDPCCGIDCGDHGVCEDGVCSCDDHYSGTTCDTADTQWQEFKSRIITNDQLVWYKTTTLQECQKRCALDWVDTTTPCIGISMRSTDDYCFLYQDSDGYGVTLESDDESVSYVAFTE